MCDTLIPPRPTSHGTETDGSSCKYTPSIDIHRRYTPVIVSTVGQLTKDISEPDNGHRDIGISLDFDASTETERLKTFTGWTNSEINPEKLAKAGFYYLGWSDAVRCPFCKTEGHQWTTGDNPMDDHTKWSPDCPFVRDGSRERQPQQHQEPQQHEQPQQQQQQHQEEQQQLEQEPQRDGVLLRSTRAVGGQDVCGNLELLPNSDTEDKTTELLNKLGVERSKPCSYPALTSVESRFTTFENWPVALKQKPTDLAEAGFFYKGVGDQTLCFHCGGGLKDWDENDDPWEQHALWFPKCNFLLLRKGQDFVDGLQNKLKAEDTSVPNTSSSSLEEQAKEPVSLPAEPEESHENRSTLCKICFRNEVGVIFIPCGHVVACVDCSLSLNNTCPVCRKQFAATIRAFLS